MTTEVWQNTFSGFDQTYGSTQWVLNAFRKLLPGPTIDPTCKRKGHRWSEPMRPLALETEVVGCIRCARRGLVVLESRGQVG
jgi:hypothetical protein